jgi:hypothetical protein
MRRGGLALVVIVLVGALARTWSPAAQPAMATLQNSTPPAARTVTSQGPASAETLTPTGPFRDKILEKIRTFFSEPWRPKGECENPEQYCVPQGPHRNIRFVIAIVPDPIHSHLSHFFDSAIEAIEQGAFNEGYAFDRAIMPWPYTIESPSSAGKITVSVSKYDSDQQAPEVSQDIFPGLMIFREGEIRLNARYDAKPDPNFDPRAEPLFVFVVGETPTAGINEDQYRTAARIIREIKNGKRPVVEGAVDPQDAQSLRLQKGAPQNEPEFGILGPTFSGSLFSLHALVQDKGNDRTLPVYSTVLGTSTIAWFKKLKPERVQMVLFQQDSLNALHALRNFAHVLEYKGSELALLAEDETAYGNSFSRKDLTGAARTPTGEILASETVANLSFPRGISQLRSEYSKEISNQPTPSAGTAQPQTNLHLDLEMTGNDDDSVAPYAKGQTAVSQEAVMRGIVSELHRIEAKFILLRASDPLDELFLTSYLRDNYPQARLVVPTPDLLFARENSAPLSGVLGLSTYPLEPAAFNPLCAGFNGADEIFRSAHGVALSNATTALIQELGRWRSDPLDSVLPAEEKKKAAGDTDEVLDRYPCKLSSDLWLTAVSGNAIRPIRVLHMPASEFFPVSSQTPPEDKDPTKAQRNARDPLTWVFAYIACLAFMFRHARLSLTGGDFGAWRTAGQLKKQDTSVQKKSRILWLGGVFLVAIMVVLASPFTPITRAERGWPDWARLLLGMPLVVFVGVISHNFWKPRKERVLAILFVNAAVVIAVLGIVYAARDGSGMVLWQQRILDLTSGVSSATPLVLLLVAFYVWFWYEFKVEALFDWRRPRLPPGKSLPKVYYNLREEVANDVREAITIDTKMTIRPLSKFSVPWVPAFSMAAVISFILPAVFLGPGHTPIRSLEGLFFDGIYCFLLGITLIMLVATLLLLLDVWWRFRAILTAMDRVGLREAITRLKGFEWNVIWNPALSVANEEHRLVLRKIQILECLLVEIGEGDEAKSSEHTELKQAIHRIMKLRGAIIGDISESPHAADHETDSDLMTNFIELQSEFANTAGLLLSSYLNEHWKRSCSAADQASRGQPAEGLSEIRIQPEVATATLRISSPAGPPADPQRLSKSALGLAEDFVASVYANFLVTVLLGIRGLVFTAVTAYACVVLSTVSYPFTPAPSLTILAIALFTLSGIVIWYIYEQMHRDATLSRLTSTEPGKLDTAFWTKFLSVGLIPLLTLMASVFPQAGHVLYTLVEPILQALR